MHCVCANKNNIVGGLQGLKPTDLLVLKKTPRHSEVSSMQSSGASSSKTDLPVMEPFISRRRGGFCFAFASGANSQEYLVGKTQLHIACVQQICRIRIGIGKLVGCSLCLSVSKWMWMQGLRKVPYTYAQAAWLTTT